MKKLFAAIAIVALVCSSMIAYAVTGRSPPANGGFRMMDSAYVLGIAQSINHTFTNGITATGTTQATATVIASGFALVEIDTVAASTGINLPPALPGIMIHFYNNGANTLTLYPAVANNPISAAQDTINNGTSTTLATHTALSCFSAKAGVWGCR
jgi:hypothetical protein